MSSSRIIFQNWIAEIGQDPEILRSVGPGGTNVRPGNDRSPAAADDAASDRDIRDAVSEAIASLDDNEREFVERHFFMGQTYVEIAEASGRRLHRLEALKKRAFKKLRRRLARFVEDRFGLSSKPETDCPICRSPNRPAIDRIIQARDPSATWRPVMRRIESEFGLKIGSPQALIGHQKYH
jgi:hypothetical protein